MFTQRAVGSNSLRGESVCINRDIHFATQNFETANVVAMLVSEQNAVQFFRRDSALFEAKDNLPCA